MKLSFPAFLMAFLAGGVTAQDVCDFDRCADCALQQTGSVLYSQGGIGASLGGLAACGVTAEAYCCKGKCGLDLANC